MRKNFILLTSVLVLVLLTFFKPLYTYFLGKDIVLDVNTNYGFIEYTDFNVVDSSYFKDLKIDQDTSRNFVYVVYDEVNRKIKDLVENQPKDGVYFQCEVYTYYDETNKLNGNLFCNFPTMETTKGRYEAVFKYYKGYYYLKELR